MLRGRCHFTLPRGSSWRRWPEFPPSGRLRTLVERHNVAHLGDIYVQQMADAIDIQVFTPAGFTI